MRQHATNAFASRPLVRCSKVFSQSPPYPSSSSFRGSSIGQQVPCQMQPWAPSCSWCGPEAQGAAAMVSRCLARSSRAFTQDARAEKPLSFWLECCCRLTGLQPGTYQQSSSLRHIYANHSNAPTPLPNNGAFLEQMNALCWTFRSFSYIIGMPCPLTAPAWGMRQDWIPGSMGKWRGGAANPLSLSSVSLVLPTWQQL